MIVDDGLEPTLAGQMVLPPIRRPWYHDPDTITGNKYLNRYTHPCAIPRSMSTSTYATNSNLVRWMGQMLVVVVRRGWGRSIG